MRVMEPHIARRLWWLFEPIHASVYFNLEAREEFDAAGLKGGWMGYFASRSAPMGAVGPEVVTATFYNFHPNMVRRAIPDAWTFSTPERVIEARTTAADRVLSRLLEAVDPDPIARAGKLMSEVVAACLPEGRPLFAATAGIEPRSEPHLVLWHAATCLREYRGDGHVGLLMQTGIDGCEAHVLMAADGKVDPVMQRTNRGWSEEEWEAATSRLVARGLIDDDDGVLTIAGEMLRQDIEDGTDRLAARPFEAIGEDGCEELISVLTPIAEAVTDGGFPYPNPMGLPKP